MIDIKYPPNINDGQAAYLCLPYLTTLYGVETTPQRWLRVIQNGSQSTINQLSNPSGKIEFEIETIPLSDFLLYNTYGWTPYLEVLFSGFDSAFSSLAAKQNVFLNQSALRNYEQRALTLMDLARRRNNSFLTRNNESAKELMAELIGTLVLWEDLMNTGSIHPYNCLDTSPIPYNMGINLTKIQEKLDELQTRLFHANYVSLPIKTTQEQRQIIENIAKQ